MNIKNLLPQIVIPAGLELNIPSNQKLSLSTIEVLLEKDTIEITTAMAQAIYDLPVERAQATWLLLDEHLQRNLLYHDHGSFNMELVQKLQVGPEKLYESFMAANSDTFLTLDTAPLNTEKYFIAFEKIRSDLLSVCKQLTSRKSSEPQFLVSFLECLGAEVLVSLVRHEIARCYIDEEHKYLHLVSLIEEKEEDEETRRPFVDVESRKEMEFGWDLTEERELEIQNYGHGELDDDQIQPEELTELENAFVRNDMVSSTLELTHWLQDVVPTIFKTIRETLLYYREVGIAFWERPNPIREEEEVVFSKSFKREGIEEISHIIESRTETQEIPHMEAELQRLTRVFMFKHPAREEYKASLQHHLKKYGNIVASVLIETGKPTESIQTFDQLKMSIWDAIGFTELKQWLEQQEDFKILLTSSGRKKLFDDMVLLKDSVFDQQIGLLYASLEESKNRVAMLHSWFCFTKMLWEKAHKQPRFKFLASIDDDGNLVWEEHIACCTLLVQATLGIEEKVFFSLQEMRKFCKILKKKTKEKELVVESSSTLSIKRNESSLSKIFSKHKSVLTEKGKNLFRVVEEIKLDSHSERELVETIKESADRHALKFVEGIGLPTNMVKLLFSGIYTKLLNGREPSKTELNEVIAYYKYLIKKYKAGNF